ncbi:AAA family ATPase [Aggregicoccus sp. 17bor-14]|uniref:nucleotide-binding protein n=1 Tax=Myxococcaceae TaxID=31 RepID=UPI00129C11BF|nr:MULTISPECIES: AAA family ATPase [Myxococcaceae]MBF5041564.1 AAA family ATPase [Simulacricoccus sp. 17bor-14]MRI87349.1 AAA family ATPase [Aggregicoccus sp. 17bor-14]
MSGATVVMQGSLSEFRLFDILQVVGISRQHTLIELRLQHRTPQGAIWVKSGQVLNARCGADEGRGAFFELFGPVADSFVVVRLQDPPRFAEPLGGLSSLLLEASNAGEDPAPPSDVHESLLQLEAPPPPVRAAPPPPARAAPPPRAVPLRAVPPAVSRTAASLARGRVLAVCSPKGGVGKSTLALNLAFALAERGLHTVLVDADPNGGQLSLLDARGRAQRGAYDLLDGDTRALDEALRPTAHERLKVLPASGPELPQAALQPEPRHVEGWRQLLGRVAQRCDVALVDCPAGMLGTTRDVLQGCTHALGVFQAEMVAGRSFDVFLQALRALPEPGQLEVLGTAVNMFQGRSRASLEAFQRLAAAGAGYRPFDTTLPRHDAFGAASLEGLPLRASQVDGARSLAFLFDMLASEVSARLGLDGPQRERTLPPGGFLL